MPSLRDITTSLHAFWSANAPPGVPTVFPGTQLDTSQAEDWIELWVDLAQELPRRAASPSRADVAITVHCFSRSRRDTLRGQTLADEVAAALGRRAVPVTDAGSPGTTIGYLQIGEPDMRNLTRVHAAVERTLLQHLVVTFSAAASDAP